MTENEIKTTENTSTIAPVKQNRFKSPILWTSVAGLVLLIFNTYGLLPKLGLDTSTYNTIVNSIIGVFVLLGILNSPTDKDSF